jgi:hypothetical protein
MVLCCFGLQFSHAQLPELGLSVGGMYYLGDLNPFGNFKLTHPTGTVFLRQNYSNRLNGRYSVTYGQVSGADSLSKVPYNRNRNLSFKSDIVEVSAILEINFLPFKPGDKKKFYASPYLMMGIGLFKMNPKANYNDRWFELQPLGTEGEGSPLNNHSKYHLTQLCIPVGIGFKGNLTERLVLGFEYCIRKTFTDYLDDVSGNYADPAQLAKYNGPLAAALADRSVYPENYNNTGVNRGNSNFKDWYASANIYIAILLKRESPCYNWGRKK